MTRWIAAVLMCALCAACWGAVPASAQTPAWSVVPSPNRGWDGLNAVSCASPVACMAVGGHLALGGLGRTMAEAWDGTRWSIVPSPNRGRGNDGLLSVSCVSPVACMAVGGSGFPSGGAPRLSGSGQRTLAEAWDGTRWSVLPSPSPGSSGTVLYGVSCVSAVACMAVGGFGNASGAGGTLAESWNGSRWSVLPSPNPGTGGALFGVSCVSADACMAVGLTGTSGGGSRTLAESWNGSRWSALPSPNPTPGKDRLFSVSCVSADTCVAVGVSGTSKGGELTLAEWWDGARWVVVPSPGPSSGINWLDGVSCASADACAAVGDYYSSEPKTLVESWDGARWSIVPSPSPGANDNVLNGVFCASESSCTAVGSDYQTGPHPGDRTLIESGTPIG